MKHRVAIACCAALVLSFSLALGQSKDDNVAKCQAGSKASGCMHGEKASLTSASKSATDPAVIPVSNKLTNAQKANITGDCTAAEKAACDKAKMTMAKAGMRAGCCTGKAKGAEAKNAVKKAGAKLAEAKGTN